jgi:hypothetical protein
LNVTASRDGYVEFTISSISAPGREIVLGLDFRTKKFTIVSSNDANKMKKLLIPTVLALLAISVQADDHRKTNDRSRSEHHNYIIERQEAYQVQGPPTDRMIIGKRQIDGYRDYRTDTTLWFEGYHVVGVTR